MRWEIGFSIEASNYAIDSHPYNEAVLQAIEFLAFSEHGLPEEAVSELEPELYLWQVEQHEVFFQRFPTERRLWIAVLKPRA
jgi:hypothetical protein